MEESTRRNTKQINSADPHFYDKDTWGTPPARNAFDEYTAFVLSKASAKNTETRIQQGIIGAATETGEMLDALKKHMFQGRPIDVVNLKEECGDLWFYFTELMAAIDTNIFEVMEMNIAKLSERYAKEFSTEESINRDLDKEREILEDRKTPPMSAKGSCESCADTACSGKPLPQRVCKGYMDNRNYPIEPTAQMGEPIRTPLDVDRDIEDIIERQRKIADDREQEELNKLTEQKACCGNCAERLQLKGCSRYDETNDDGCCIDHKFLSEGESK